MEKPILFNTDMVHAVLDGTKTATRRVIKPQPKAALAYACMGHKYGTWGYADRNAYKIWGDRYRLPEDIPDGGLKRRWTPPCNTGDTLWVRETWSYDVGGIYIYEASYTETFTGSKKINAVGDKIKWRPSIHMPKDAARIWLKVTGVTVERLHDMTLDDFLSEGVVLRPEAFNDPDNAYLQAREIFKGIWDSTVRKKELARYGWEANPWVWAVKFERSRKDKE